jgi:hypothetical protein
VQNLETGRLDRAEGKGRRAGEYRVKRQNRELRQEWQTGRTGQKDAAKGLPGKGSIRRQDRTKEALGSVERTGAETGTGCFWKNGKYSTVFCYCVHTQKKCVDTGDK